MPDYLTSFASQNKLAPALSAVQRAMAQQATDLASGSSPKGFKKPKHNAVLLGLGYLWNWLYGMEQREQQQPTTTAGCCVYHRLTQTELRMSPKTPPQEFAGTHKEDSTTINLTLTRLLLRVIFSVVHKVHSGCYSLKNLSCEGRVIRLCWASCVGDPDKRIHNRQHLTGFERERPTETGSQERAIIDLLAKQA